MQGQLVFAGTGTGTGTGTGAGAGAATMRESLIHSEDEPFAQILHDYVAGVLQHLVGRLLR
jgi:hypothetical protein